MKQKFDEQFEIVLQMLNDECDNTLSDFYSTGLIEDAAFLHKMRFFRDLRNALFELQNIVEEE